MIESKLPDSVMIATHPPTAYKIVEGSAYTARTGGTCVRNVFIGEKNQFQRLKKLKKKKEQQKKLRKKLKKLEQKESGGKKESGRRKQH